MTFVRWGIPTLACETLVLAWADQRHEPAIAGQSAQGRASA